MSHFEKLTQIDGGLNGHQSREKVFSIEMTDEQYIESKLAYRQVDKDKVPKEKLEKARKIEKGTKVISLHGKRSSKKGKV